MKFEKAQNEANSDTIPRKSCVVAFSHLAEEPFMGIKKFGYLKVDLGFVFSWDSNFNTPSSLTRHSILFLTLFK